MTTADTILAAATAAQHGFTTHRQLAELGLSNEQIANRLERGVLLSTHQGVYRHAAAPWTPRGRLLAAVLACGSGAIASHRSAARLHQLREVPGSRPEVTLTGARLPLRGATVHRTDTMELLDITSVDRVPVTTIPRTLLDLGAVVPLTVVELAAQDAVIQGRVSTVDLICVLERVGRRGRRGTAALRAVVQASLPSEGIASMLELRLQRLIEQCPLPPPVLQHEIVVAEGKHLRLDKAWPDLRITIEADGRRWHSTRQDFERGMARRRAITAAGWDHYSYGWADVHQRAATVRAEITAVFASALVRHPLTHPELCRMSSAQHCSSDKERKVGDEVGYPSGPS